MYAKKHYNNGAFTHINSASLKLWNSEKKCPGHEIYPSFLSIDLSKFFSIYIHTGWANVGLQLWVCKIQSLFLYYYLFINYCIIYLYDLSSSSSSSSSSPPPPPSHSHSSSPSSSHYYYYYCYYFVSLLMIYLLSNDGWYFNQWPTKVDT